MSLAEVPTLFSRRPATKPDVDATINNNKKLRLFRGADVTGRYVSSPFVTKVEFRLRLGGQDYNLGGGMPWLGPKGKIPYVEVAPESGVEGEKPEMLGDSALIIQRLVADGSLQPLNESLSPADKTYDLALRSLLEDKLYFYHMRECWMDNYYSQRDQALGAIPYPIRIFVGQRVYGIVTRTLHGQGCGRLSSEEVDGFRREIWNSFEDMLEPVARQHEQQPGNEPFWLLDGEGPTEADVTLFSFVAGIMAGSAVPGSQALIRSLPSVMEYASRIHDKYFVDYQKWSSMETPAKL